MSNTNFDVSRSRIIARLVFLSSAPLVLTAAIICVPAQANPNQYLEMFLDDVRIQSTSGVQLTLNQPDRLPDPVITGSGGQWERLGRSFGSVIYDEEESLFKAWYQVRGGGVGNPVPGGITHGNPVAYATSVDGLNWDYPNLGLVEFSNNNAAPFTTDNNLLFRGLENRALYNVSVIKDDADPDPMRRYKIIYFDSPTSGILNNAGVFTGTSPDGIHWTRTDGVAHPELVVVNSSNSVHDVIELMYDSQNQKYVIYSKGYDRSNNTNDHRQITRSESSDFINWTEPVPVLGHDNTLLDPQSYGSSAFEYQGMYIMPLRIYHNTGLADGQQGDRTIDVQLAASRDGINWTRVADKATFMQLGADGTWDDGMIMPYRPFAKDDSVYLYYHAWDGPHENPDGSPVSRRPSVGLATLDSGRFAAMGTATGTPGSTGMLTTTTFFFENGHIFLNAELGQHGSIGVSVLDAAGQVLTDYTAAISSLREINDLYYAVSFEDADLTSLINQNVRLRFDLEGDALLYGYTTAWDVVPEPTAGLLLVGLGLLLNRRRHSSRTQA